MLTEKESILIDEQINLKHAETGKTSKIILFIFIVSLWPPNQKVKNTSSFQGHSLGFRRWWWRGFLSFSRPSLRASPLGELSGLRLRIGDCYGRWDSCDLRCYGSFLYCRFFNVAYQRRILKWTSKSMLTISPTSCELLSHIWLWIETPVKMNQCLKGMTYRQLLPMYSKPTNIFFVEAGPLIFDAILLWLTKAAMIILARRFSPLLLLVAVGCGVLVGKPWKPWLLPRGGVSGWWVSP